MSLQEEWLRLSGDFKVCQDGIRTKTASDLICSGNTVDSSCVRRDVPPKRSVSVWPVILRPPPHAVPPGLCPLDPPHAVPSRPAPLLPQPSALPYQTVHCPPTIVSCQDTDVTCSPRYTTAKSIEMKNARRLLGNYSHFLQHAIIILPTFWS